MPLSILPARRRIVHPAIQQALRPVCGLLLAMLGALSLAPALTQQQQQQLLQQMQHNWPQQLRTGPASSVDQLTLISWWHQGKAGQTQSLHGWHCPKYRVNRV